MQTKRGWRHAMAWQTLVEIARRHPKSWIIETHPGGGQYECLTLVAPSGALQFMNLVGSINGLQGLAGGGWVDLAVKGPFSMARRLGKAHGLPVPSALPEYTRRTAAYSFVAGALELAMACGEQELWTTQNGYLDASDCSGTRRALFNVFPPANERLTVEHPHDLQGESAYRFWFLVRQGEPVLAVETSGRAWSRDGRERDLLAAVKEDGDLVRVLMDLCGPLVSKAN